MKGYFGAYVAWTTLMLEAQTVIAWRMAGLMGLAPMPKGEEQRMAMEKPAVFAESALALGRAVWTGAAPISMVRIWSAPLTRAARSNRKRLGRHRSSLRTGTGRKR